MTRTDLLIAGTLAALALGGVALVVHYTRTPALGTADAVAVQELQLRDRPDDAAGPHAFIAQGSPVRVEATAAPGWVYVYQPLGTGAVLEGYVRANLVGPPGPSNAARGAGPSNVARGAGPSNVARGAGPSIARAPLAMTGQMLQLQDSFRRLVLNPNVPAAPSPIVRIRRVPTSDAIVDRLRQSAPRLRLPWLDAPITYLTGELPRGAAVDMLVADAERARTALDADFRQQTGGPALRSVSTFRSFDDQAGIVAGVLRSLGLGAASDADAIRRGLLQSLTTRSIPGFSRHHWGTDLDVLSAESRAWGPGGQLAQFVQPLTDLAPAHGLYHPYREGAYPEPARAHYNAEPWHLSLAVPGEVLRQRWLSEIANVPAEYNSLLDRAAGAIATRAGLDVMRTRQALGSIDLASYVRNVAPAPTGVIA